MKEAALFVFTGLTAGVCSGIFGIGGGVIIVPILVILFGYQQQTATGTSLVAMLLPVGVLGVLNYYQSDKINSTNIKAGLFIAAGMFFGAYLGSAIAMPLNETLLRKLFAGFLLVVAIRLWFAPKM